MAPEPAPAAPIVDPIPEVPPTPESMEELPKVNSLGHLKLGLIVGHEAKAPGATMLGGISEYQYGKDITDKVKLLAPKIDGRIDIEIILRDHIGILGAYAKARELLCDAVIELHFNSFFDGSVHGSLTLCSPDVSDVDFAHIVHSQICEAFKRSGASLGVKTLSKSGRGGANVHSFPGGVNCLVEPFFGDNQSDAALASRCALEYAGALVRAAQLWGRKVDLLA